MESINSLLNLYRVDGQVRALQKRLDSAQRYLQAQTKNLDALTEQLQELKTRKRQTQATIGNLEVETAAADERLEKLRTELNSAVTNKQYSAVLTELNTVKLNRSEVEDRILGDMERIEQLEKQIDGVQAQRDDRGKVRDVAQSELDQRQANIGQRLEELADERRAAAAEVPPAALAIFDEMADCYDGEALATILEIDRRHREYACGSCNMHVPFERISLLLGGSDDVVRCTACSRILYLQEETRGSLAKK